MDEEDQCRQRGKTDEYRVSTKEYMKVTVMCGSADCVNGCFLCVCVSGEERMEVLLYFGE